MRIALLTNSKLSIPAINFLAGNNLLVAVGIPDRENKTEDADFIRHTAAHHHVPVSVFRKDEMDSSLGQWMLLSAADVVFVFTFPFRIPATMLGIPSKGFINFHFGLLPQYRGADAIFWQIRNGEREGGVSVHRMNEQFDKGPLFLIQKVPISPQDTYGSHLLNLSMAAIPAVEKTLNALQAEEPALNAQDESLARYYGRPVLPDVTIDWSQPAASIIALINATNPWNKGAVTYLNEYPIKVVAASPAQGGGEDVSSSKPGTIIVANENRGCIVRCGSGELLNLDILYCNDSFITAIQFIKLGIAPGIRFERPPEFSTA
jgi:methionyl-tRNA formyltransferase